MKSLKFVASIAAVAMLSPVMARADEMPASDGAGHGAADAAPPKSDMISTGVAKGRDRLDSAVSTSTLHQDDIERTSARNIGQILHTLAGIRAGDTLGDGNADITVRGLPLTSSGAKYLQLQEDGLPVLEFGDIIGGTSDLFLHFDSNVAQIEAIRGGSASTFASNSPAGIINFISRTGDVAGGSLQASTGINYDEKRLDFEYGQPIDERTRFHAGGYWRQGEGPRHTGFKDTVYGGQIKLNVTRDLAIGYVRLYLKVADDRSPIVIGVPMQLSGSDANPTYSALPGNDPRRDTLLSPYTATLPQLAPDGSHIVNDLRKGQHGVAKSVGLETQLNFGEWTLMERFRYSAQSGDVQASGALFMGTPDMFAAAAGLGPVQLSFASGPNKGQAITDPAAQLGAGGVLTMNALTGIRANDLGNVTNDLRVSRVWSLGDGELTTTGGFYTARQAVRIYWTTTNYVTSSTGHGNNVLVDLADADGPVTERGVFSYYDPLFTFQGTRVIDVDYGVNAGFGSLNFRKGKFAVGGSVRYDFGSGRGTYWGNELAPPNQGYGCGNIVPGSTARAACTAPVNTLAWSAPVNYNYHYTSYSAGINYRPAQQLSIFARYSKGGRANADRMLFTSLLDPASGGLTSVGGAVGTVKQAEAGFKLRQRDYLVNATVFWAKTRDYDAFFGPLNIRDYTAYGLELEGEIHHGPWALNANATYTHARVDKDFRQPQYNGNKPLQQPDWMVNLVPHYDSGKISAGAYIYLTTKRYSDITNTLVLPAYTTVNPYVQFRPTAAMSVSVNVYNVFNTMGITSLLAPNIASTVGGIGTGTTILGRTGTASVKFAF